MDAQRPQWDVSFIYIYFYYLFTVYGCYTRTPSSKDANEPKGEHDSFIHIFFVYFISLSTASGKCCDVVTSNAVIYLWQCGHTLCPCWKPSAGSARWFPPRHRGRYLMGFEGFNPFSGVPLVHQNSGNHMWKRTRCVSRSSAFNAVIYFFILLDLCMSWCWSHRNNNNAVKKTPFMLFTHKPVRLGC